MTTATALLMYDACIMNQMRRTTITARASSLATLEAEAERRGVSLSSLIAEAVDDKAEALRARRRPRLGLGDSQGLFGPASEAVYAPDEDWRV